VRASRRPGQLSWSTVPSALIVPHDVVGPAMAGPGIRYWEIAAALRRRGIETTLAAPPHGEDLVAVAARHDSLLVTGPVLEQHPGLKGLGVPLAIDWYDPFLFENLARGVPMEQHEGGVRTLAEQARCGDFFVCASERQRDLGLGMLAAWGRLCPQTYAADPMFKGLIDVVPFGVASSPPVSVGAKVDGGMVVWNGGLWDWFDPLTAIRAIGSLPGVRMVFMGTRHPNPAVGEPTMAGRARALVAELGLGDRISFREWTPYASRGELLVSADVAVSLHVEGAETRFAYRTRLLDCIWAGLPVVSTLGDVLGDELAARGLGIAVPEGDSAAVAEAIARVLGDTDRRGWQAERFAAMAEEMSWDRMVEPLARWMAAPRRAADRQSTEVESAVQAPSVAPETRTGLLARLRRVSG